MNEMSAKTKVSFGLYLLLLIVGAAFYAIYATASGPMPYHVQAMETQGIPWDSLQPAVQWWLLNAIHLLGYSGLVLYLSLAVLLFIPFRQGQRWSRWAIPGIFLAEAFYSSVVAFRVAAKTGASTPRGLAIVLLVILIAAFLLSGDVGKRRQYLS